MKNWNSVRRGKCEVCPVGSTRREAHFCFPSNKDKSRDTNAIYPWLKLSTETKCKTRSCSLSCATPSLKCTMHETRDFEEDRSKFNLFYHVHPLSSVFLVKIIFRSSLNLPIFGTSVSKYRNRIIIERKKFSNFVNYLKSTARKKISYLIGL